MGFLGLLAERDYNAGVEPSKFKMLLREYSEARTNLKNQEMEYDFKTYGKMMETLNDKDVPISQKREALLKGAKIQKKYNPYDAKEIDDFVDNWDFDNAQYKIAGKQLEAAFKSLSEGKLSFGEYQKRIAAVKEDVDYFTNDFSKLKEKFSKQGKELFTGNQPQLMYRPTEEEGILSREIITPNERRVGDNLLLPEQAELIRGKLPTPSRTTDSSGKQYYTDITDTGKTRVREVKGKTGKPATRSEPSLQRKIKKYKENGKTMGQLYNFNPKTGKDEIVGEPFELPAGSESLIAALLGKTPDENTVGFVKPGYYIDANGEKVWVETEEEYKELMK